MPLVLTVPPYPDFDAVVASTAATWSISPGAARWRVLSDLISDDDPTLDGEREAIDRSLWSLRALLRQSEAASIPAPKPKRRAEAVVDAATIDLLRRAEAARAGYEARREAEIAARFAAEWSRVALRRVESGRFDRAVSDLRFASLRDLYVSECADLDLDPDDRAPARQSLADRVASSRSLPPVLPPSLPPTRIDPDRVALLRAEIEATGAALREVDREIADRDRRIREERL